MINTIDAVLFDLDGTLLDTAPDLIFALNQLRHEHGLAALAPAKIRSIVSLGSKAMIKMSLGIEENDPRFPALREQFFNLYQNHLADSTKPFPEVPIVLTRLAERNIPWGIVTNKLTRHTMSLLKATQIAKNAGCIVCGDSLPTYKPDPAPILHACQLLQQRPERCIYVGDSLTDVEASKAAGMPSLVALYGYISSEEDPYTWQATGYIHHPIELLQWLFGTKN